jgi:holo-[acyl-carrier protein] synthase
MPWENIANPNYSIRGLGVDLIEIERIAQAIARHPTRFLEKLFTPKEIAYCSHYANSAVHFAGRFAGKEAIAKALGTGFGSQLYWQDLEIINNRLGKPEVFFSSAAQARFDHPTILLTISHTKQLATATALWLHNATRS